MQEIVWLAHGGPGSGRYPKGSGKKYLKTMNRYSKGSARMEYWKKFNQKFVDQADRRIDRAERKGYRASKKQYNVRNKYQGNVDNLQKKIDSNSVKIQNIRQRLENAMNTPIKTVTGRTMNYRVYSPLLTIPYTKYKVDKKALKNR